MAAIRLTMRPMLTMCRCRPSRPLNFLRRIVQLLATRFVIGRAKRLCQRNRRLGSTGRTISSRNCWVGKASDVSAPRLDSGSDRSVVLQHCRLANRSVSLSNGACLQLHFDWAVLAQKDFERCEGIGHLGLFESTKTIRDDIYGLPSFQARVLIDNCIKQSIA